MGNDSAAWTRRYPVDADVHRAAGRFANSVVMASLPPADWQFGEDVEQLTRNLTAVCVDDEPTATEIEVQVLLNPVIGYAEVLVTSNKHARRAGRAEPRRPISTPHLRSRGRAKSSQAEGLRANEDGPAHL